MTPLHSFGQWFPSQYVHCFFRFEVNDLSVVFIGRVLSLVTRLTPVMKFALGVTVEYVCV